MIPVLLRFKGLYSYSSEQTIHFERLIEAGLFGIFGSVGSGKSSIIEAISFVLYYNTERMNSRENRLYHMMNLKSNELVIDFEFINFQGQAYRFGLRAKRNKKQYDKIENPVRSAYRKIKESWEPIDPLEIDAIIGLSYENFKRTIIIPQGRFQEFLQLGDADRTRMMKEIFALEKYDFADRTSSLEKDNQALRTHLEGRLHAFTDLNEEAILLAEKEAGELAVLLGNLRKGLLEKEKAFNEMEKLKQLHFEKGQEKNRLAILLEEEERWARLEEEIGRLDYCLQHFKSEIDLRKRIRQQLIHANEALVQLESARTKEEASFDAIQVEFEGRKLDFENHEKFQASLHDLVQILEIRKLEAESDRLNAKVVRGSEMLAAEMQKRQQLDEQKQGNLSSLADLKSNLPDLSILTEVQIWFNKYKTLTQDIEADRQRFAAFLKHLELLYATLPAQAGQIAEENYTNVFKQAELALDLSLEQNQEQQKQLQEDLMHLNIQIKLSEYADSLHENEPCPLCGSTHHPDIAALKNPIGEEKTLQNRIESLKQEEKMIHLARQDLQLNKNEIFRIHVEKKEIETALTNRLSQLESHRREFIWPRYKINQEEEVKMAKLQHQQMLLKTHEKERTQSELEISLKENEKTILQYRELLEKRNIELNTVKSRMQEKLSTLKTQAINEVSGLGNAELEAQAFKLEKKIASVKILYTACLAELNQKNAELAGIKAAISEKQSSLQKEKSDLELIESALGEKLLASPFSDLKELEELLNDGRDWSLARQEIRSYRIQVSNGNARILSLEEKLQGKIFDITAFEGIKEELTILKIQVQEKNDLFVRLSAELGDMEKRFSEKQKLSNEYEKLSKRAENLKIMKGLFSGSGFVNYISSVHMSALCEEANKRFFKLSRQQLKLEVSDTNNFLVRDFLNEGKLRSVKTLSGGQTFQASLSLALALTESVQKQSKAVQNFFFLDEGFGSLDKESLQLAYDTLKLLYKENRIVGLISHVEELQQEIGIFLQVSRDEVEGSQIHASWERRMSN